MPITYRIDADRELVLTTASGVLTDDDIVNLRRTQLADPRFDASMRELADVRAVTDLRVTTQGIRAMVAVDASALGAHRLAIVATENATFGMARMYQTLTEKHNPHVGVFRDLEEAGRWLMNPLPG